MRFLMMFCLSLALSAPAKAQGFSQVSERQKFVSLVEGRKLTRFGIKLDVTGDGRIIGRAFGRPVTGAWNWRSGYFCRDLYWGDYAIGANCQAVKVQGETLRFISDRGAGQSADLQLR
ncbi:dihydrodipicolinate reductase [Roseovarius gahaiensis]|uniref:Dihydrodipicolinate reductase n=1 Tax=Roseovarius gahaiensis TaxID=2716691 RepID=A0A967BBG8_9RHOB|nr:dihydrodipicolinate reductase [Roseovarius gahaiensis]NHQ73229.1 dihydrodipicolinate reductase [Roseovarius gahaiensis]